MPTPPKRATIMNVATEAGVSKSLVSLAFKDPSKVSDERLKRIRTAADKLNYSPSFVAQTLTSQSSPFVGILVLDLHNPIFIEIANAVRRTLAQHGEFGLMMSGSEESSDQPGRPYGTLDPQVLHMLQSLRPKALIVVGTANQEKELPAGIPIIYASAAAAASSHHTCVRADDMAGMELLIDHLTDLGHQSIAFAAGSSGAVTKERQEAYENLLATRGLNPTVLTGDYTEAGGYQAGKALLEVEPRPTAVIAVNDLSALGLIRAAEEAGVKVPEDLAVAGFDNIQLAGIPRISLTSVDPDKAKIGELAAFAAMEGIAQGATRVELLEVAPRLMARTSTLGAGT